MQGVMSIACVAVQVYGEIQDKMVFKTTRSENTGKTRQAQTVASRSLGAVPSAHAVLH